MVFDEYPGGMVGRADVVARWLLVDPLGGGETSERDCVSGSHG